MMYCTKCGSDLKGNNVRCPVCGYEVQKMKMDLSKPREVRRAATREKKAWAPPIPDQRKEPQKREDEEVEEVKVKVQEEEELDDPRYVDGCVICGSRPVRRCFFTLSPLCDRHTVWMQIYVRTMPFGEKVPSSPEIASQKEGRVPLDSEAKEAGMFFTIKPYHLWKRV